MYGLCGLRWDCGEGMRCVHRLWLWFWPPDGKKEKRTLIFYLKETRVGYPLDSYIFTKKHRKVHKNKTNKQKQIAIFRAVWQTPGCHLVLFSLCSQSLSGPSVVPATVILVSKPYQVPSYCSLFEEDYLFCMLRIYRELESLKKYTLKKWVRYVFYLKSYLWRGRVEWGCHE